MEGLEVAVWECKPITMKVGPHERKEEQVMNYLCYWILVSVFSRLNSRNDLGSEFCQGPVRPPSVSPVVDLASLEEKEESPRKGPHTLRHTLRQAGVCEQSRCLRAKWKKGLLTYTLSG